LDIYINNYTTIQDNKMPPSFYSLSTAFMWIVVCQVLMLVGNFISKKKQTKELFKGEKNSVFDKMNVLYSAQHSSLNAILNIVNFIMVIILYVTSEMFVTNG